MTVRIEPVPGSRPCPKCQRDMPRDCDGRCHTVAPPASSKPRKWRR